LHERYDILIGNFKHISTILVAKFIMKTKAECKQNSVKSFGHRISCFGLVLTSGTIAKSLFLPRNARWLTRWLPSKEHAYSYIYIVVISYIVVLLSDANLIPVIICS